MKISLTNRASNFNEVELNDITLWFSYKTVVGFHTSKTGIVCIENLWGPTTGKHLNSIQPDKKKRVSNEKFNEMLETVLNKL